MPRRRPDPDKEMPEQPGLSTLQEILESLMDRGGVEFPLEITYTEGSADVNLGFARYSSRKCNLVIRPGNSFWRRIKQRVWKVLLGASRLIPFVPAARKLIGNKSSTSVV